MLAAIILTNDEVTHIADCIASVQPWVDSIVVFDSYRNDEVCALAEAAGATVYRRVFDNFAAQRQAALEWVAADWVLFVDADERVTPALGAEVRQAITTESVNGYWLPRRNLIVGHEMRHGGYFPDYQLRLLRRSAAHYDANREVHEVVDVGGAEGWLHEPLIHYNYASWSQFHRKQWVYAAYEARILAARGIRPRPHNFILQPLREFRRRYVTLHGWKDGLPGLRLALLLAWYYGFIPYWILANR
ncbi:MAG: glycosyltransferase family 2 protein [Caldilineaceae bacterium]|nr:glycosyltransferase family 2 protein [Caldilineaceae bacterium]